MKALVFVADPPPGFVTVKLRTPVAAPTSMLTFTDSDVPLPLTEFTVMPDPPKVTSAPGAKPVPDRARHVPGGSLRCGRRNDRRDRGLRVGNSRQPQMALPPPEGLVTRTSCAPSVALFPTLRLRVRCAESTNVVPPMIEYPLPPRIATMEPLVKALPRTVSVVRLTPRPTLEGVTEVTPNVGATTE